MTNAGVADTRTREGLLLLGFLLLCAAGVVTVLLPEARDDAEPAKAASPASAHAPQTPQTPQTP